MNMFLALRELMFQTGEISKQADRVTVDKGSKHWADI